ncbi:hypothetical protein [Neochlamydia sp. S13]|uniref:hypothetical protein n=1 Tax=Neochlamydia sp. S13 TaxID=1353976 RepID=UPI0005AA99AA|nr:hypothetical protein [Neochlamydia sp. S13]BBI17731.1 hypothetical protein NCS13_1_1536 [Neochlamydia sp. S13]
MLKIDSGRDDSSYPFTISQERYIPKRCRREDYVTSMLENMQGVFNDYLKKLYKSNERRGKFQEISRSYRKYVDYIKNSPLPPYEISSKSPTIAEELKGEGKGKGLTDVISLSYIIATCQLLARDILAAQEKNEVDLLRHTYTEGGAITKLQKAEHECKTSEIINRKQKLKDYEKALEIIIDNLTKAREFARFLSSSKRTKLVYSMHAEMAKKYSSKSTPDQLTSQTKAEIKRYIEVIGEELKNNKSFIFPVGYLRKNPGSSRASEGHLLMIEIEYLSTKHFKVTLINTGEKAKEYEGHPCALNLDVIITHESLLDILNSIANYRCLIQESTNINELYECFKPLISSAIEQKNNMRQPPQQTGGTCAHSSIIAYLYIRLEPKLFKFYMEKYGSYVLEIWNEWRLPEELSQKSRSENIINELENISTNDTPRPTFSVRKIVNDSVENVRETITDGLNTATEGWNTARKNAWNFLS